MTLTPNAYSKVALIPRITGDKAPALKTGQIIVRVDPSYFHPTKVETF